MTKCKLHCIQVMILMARMMMMLMTMMMTTMMMLDKDHDNHDHEDSIDDNDYDKATEYDYRCENAIIFLFRIMLLSRTNSTSEIDFSSLFAF